MPDHTCGNYTRHARIWESFTGDRTPEVDCWVNIARQYGHRVLALMAATGEVAALIADRGFEVTAVDLTPAMVLEGRRRYGLRETLEFVKGDVRTLNLPRKDYDFAFVGTGDFHHLLSKEERAKALKNIATHIRIGGGLALELWYPGNNSWQTPLRTFEPLRTLSDDLNVWKEANTSFDSNTRVVQIRQEVFVQTSAGLESFRHDFSLQLFSKDELEDVLNQTGCQLVAEYGDYNLDRWEEGAKTWIVEAIKKEG